MSISIGQRVGAAWNAFWYSPAPPLNLAAARVVFAVQALWVLGSRDLAALSGVPAVFWAGVPAGDRWRYLLFPGHPGIEQLCQASAFVALAAAALGIWPRAACFCAGVLLYHLAPLEAIFWTPNAYERGLTVAVLALLALSFSRSGDALSVMARHRRAAPPSADYQWPVRLVQVFVCQVYFISGFAKLARAGFAWVSAGNIRGWLLVFSQQDQIWVVKDVGAWIADQPFLCFLIALGAITLDFGLITVVVWPRLRAWLIPAALAFHAGILVTMGILFLNLPQLLVFVDWTALRDRWRQKKAAPVDPADADAGRSR